MSGVYSLADAILWKIAIAGNWELSMYAIT